MAGGPCCSPRHSCTCRQLLCLHRDSTRAGWGSTARPVLLQQWPRPAHRSCPASRSGHGNAKASWDGDPARKLWRCSRHMRSLCSAQASLHVQDTVACSDALAEHSETCYPAGMCLLCTVQAPAATTAAATTTLPSSPNTLRPRRPPVFFLPTCRFTDGCSRGCSG